VHDVAPEQLESAAAAAVTSFTSRALGLLDRIARTPIPQLSGGGIGVRELGKLTKQLGAKELEIRLLLALAAATELLHPQVEGLGVSDTFGEWRRAEPAVQAASLLAAWWTFPSAPTQFRDAAGKALPVLRGADPCAGCQAARIVLLDVAGALPDSAAADPAALARFARWRRPMLHVLPQDADAPLATVWREAELLGAVALGALSPLGATLLADDDDGLLDHLRRLLPAASDSATFGSDLTVLVAGAPSARVTALLDSCADRESSGGAITWRFSPSSVRRALDGGVPAEALLEQLAGIAGRDLPQPLAYLIGDVARRHGSLRLLPAVSLIRSDDEALLAEVVADRRLAGLGLQHVSPTVVSCTVPLDEALARLRAVGYFPVAEPGAGVPTPPAKQRARKADPSLVRYRQRQPPARESPVLVDPRVVAARLIADGDLDLPAASPIAALLARAATELSAGEVDQLAHAVENGGRLRITYCAASGAITDRVICDPDLDQGMLYAWCELRQDERVFAIARILSVAPAI
jgi:hypothetical protein